MSYENQRFRMSSFEARAKFVIGSHITLNAQH